MRLALGNYSYPLSWLVSPGSENWSSVLFLYHADRNNLGLVGAAAIARSLVDIEVLNVDHNYLGAEGARLLVSSLAKLTELKIGMTPNPHRQQ